MVEKSASEQTYHAEEYGKLDGPFLKVRYDRREEESGNCRGEEHRSSHTDIAGGKAVMLHVEWEIIGNHLSGVGHDQIESHHPYQQLDCHRTLEMEVR